VRQEPFPPPCSVKTVMSYLRQSVRKVHIRISRGNHLICYQRSVLIGGRSHSDVTQVNPKVRWFTPDKPDNISVGRERIASHLRQNEGFNVDVVGTTLTTVRTAIRERDRYDVILGTTRAGAIAGTLIGRVTGKPVIVDHVDPIRQFRENNPSVLFDPSSNSRKYLIRASRVGTVRVRGRVRSGFSLR